MSTKPNWKAYKLAKRVEQAKWESYVYDVKPLRPKSYSDIVAILMDWELPDRADFRSRSWKRNRKTQYKGR